VRAAGDDDEHLQPALIAQIELPPAPLHCGARRSPRC
jgi:hypothetical protein